MFVFHLFVCDKWCKNVTVKRKRGRPIGGKSDAAVRAYWRYTKSNYRARMQKHADKDIQTAAKKCTP